MSSADTNNRKKKKGIPVPLIIVIVLVIVVGLIVVNNVTKNSKSEVAQNSTQTTTTTENAGNDDYSSYSGNERDGKSHTSSQDSPLLDKIKHVKEPVLAPGKDGISVHIKGALQNISKDKFNYIKIEFDLFDKDGKKLGYADGSRRDLESGAEWEYDASGYFDNAVSFKLVNVTGYY